MDDEVESTKLKETVAVLTQGVEMHNYEENRRYMQQVIERVPRLVWLDPELFRICIDNAQPTIAERSLGKVPPGLYLRDISEVRVGPNSSDFKKFQSKIPDECCLTLIGSEYTFSLELSTKEARDWFVVGFRLLVESHNTEDDKRLRRYKMWEKQRINELSTAANNDAAARFERLLHRGIQVKCHLSSGVVAEGVLHSPKNDALALQIVTGKYWNGTKKTEKMSISLHDISEIRPGSHSYAFVKTESTSQYNVALSIVASEHVFSLEFINLTARDMFAERLFYFITTHNLSKPSAPTPTRPITHHDVTSSPPRETISEPISTRSYIRTPETTSRLYASSAPHTLAHTRTVTNTLHTATEENEDSNYDSMMGDIYRTDSRQL